MNKRRIAAAWLLAATVAPVPNAQAQSRTSAVQHLTPDSSTRVTGRMRQLKCRGKAGIDLKIHQDPSPRDKRKVTMVLRYGQVQRQRALEQVGMGSVDRGVAIVIVPGSCSWSVPGDNNVPPEPGVVYFDLARDGQAGARPGTRDTALAAAESFPDATNLPRYLSDPDRWWMFYVDDASNLSISFGSMRAYRQPNIGSATGVSLGSASTTRSGAATGHGVSSTRSTPGSGTASGARPVRVPGVVTTKPAPGSSAAINPRPGDRSPGGRTAATDRVVRAPLQLRGVSTVLGSFTVSFSARASALPTVLYGTDKPVRDRETGDWVFPGGRGATGSYEVQRPGGGSTVLPGTPAVVAGTPAHVVRRSRQAFRADYTATSRPRSLGRGELYHYIITVPAGPDVSQEQYVGQFATVSQTVRTTITSFTILKTSVYARDLKYDFVAWTDAGGGGPFEMCRNTPCENTGDYLRLLVFANPPLNAGTNVKPAWDAQPSPILGVARRVFDLRAVPDDRPVRAFTLRSQSGDIEFEVQGTLEVVRR